MASKEGKSSKFNGKFNFLKPWHPYEEDLQRIVEANYPGSGTEVDPYVIDFIEGDAEDPELWPEFYKWLLTALVAIVALAVTFCSSEYTADEAGIMRTFNVAQEVVTVGVSVFVLGFALGPLLWGPLSEVFGRRPIFIVTYILLTCFNVGCAVTPTIAGLIVMRFFAGAFGSSSLTNSGASISDMFLANKRGVAMAYYAAAPLMGPVIGPVVGGFVGETVGWRFLVWTMVFFTGTMLALGTLFLPETYHPVVLHKRAQKLAAATGKVYVTKFEGKGGLQLKELVKVCLVRPWVLVFTEPIVALLCLYMSIVYGILYMQFGAFPVVFQHGRGWSPGIGGLAFIGIAFGVASAVFYADVDNRRYIRIQKEHNGTAPPEARLPPLMVGGLALPISLFWFAWTDQPSVHWIVPIIASAPFGFGMVTVFLACTNYLVDTYLMYAASVLSAKIVTRSTFGAVFPLFTAYMYQDIGIHWAASVPGFLSLLCLPCPFLFWYYGPVIRQRCKHAAECARFAAESAAVVEEVAEVRDISGRTSSEEAV